MQQLPVAIYENRIEPTAGNTFYVVPEKDSAVAECFEVTEVSGNHFTAGEHIFSWTGCVGHVGKNVHANAYDSVASYHAVTMIPKMGWTQHVRRKDVFYRLYTNRRIDPPIRRYAHIQLDHQEDRMVLLGYFFGEGRNMLGYLSQSCVISANDHSSPFKIRDYMLNVDAIIQASYAMNITKESAKEQILPGNFDRGAE
jgi:hypothetical protein